jgi:hypothetical protein
MLPSMASTMAVSKVDPVPESRVTGAGFGLVAVGRGWYDKLIECSDVTGRVNDTKDPNGFCALLFGLTPGIEDDQHEWDHH